MASREKTVADHKERINRVLLYIQDNISGSLSLETLSKVACFSPFHFQRLFYAYVGETLSSYVRRVRLEKAAIKLIHTDAPVTSIALDAGYETPAAFTKAFGQHFGKTPSEFKAIKGIEFSQKLLELNEGDKEGIAVKPEIRSMPEQKVLFVRRTGKYEKAASEAWSALMKFAYSRKLMTKNTCGIGISHDDPNITPEEKIRYDACITIDRVVKPEGDVGIQTIAGGRYAMFLHRGAYERFEDTYRAIFSKWLPESGERLRDCPCFEVYLNRDPRRTKPENLKTEIYVPIE